MAQLNPNFEIDFSDINSYEQIQLIKDAQIAKENLLMHRAYKEPSDDEIIKNRFSSFTFVDFCPRLFATNTISSQLTRVRLDSQSKILSNKPRSHNQQAQVGNPLNYSNANNNQNNSPVTNDKSSKYHELESFSHLFDRVNAWLKLNKDWRVVSMETLVYDCSSQFNHLKSSIYSLHLPKNTRGLRLFLCPSKSRFSGHQKIGCINVVPRKLSGNHLNPTDDPPIYENLDQILKRLNELLLTRPIEGRILSVETISLPMVDGYVNTEANYFLDSRLNLLGELTHTCCHGGRHLSGQSGCQATPSSGQPPTQPDDFHQGVNRHKSHQLIDILRVFYEFGSQVCGLVNVIDFIPRFYSPTPSCEPGSRSLSPQLEPLSTGTSGHSDHRGEPDTEDRLDEGDCDDDFGPVKTVASETLTRLIRRSLAWFDEERKRTLADGCQMAREHLDELPPVNLKLCNVQVHSKVLLRGQIHQANPLDLVESRSMLHRRKCEGNPLSCQQCGLSTDLNSQQDWCSHLIESTRTCELKFVRLAYVVPVHTKYIRSTCPLRPLSSGTRRDRDKGGANLGGDSTVGISRPEVVGPQGSIEKLSERPSLDISDNSSDCSDSSSSTSGSVPSNSELARFLSEPTGVIQQADQHEELATDSIEPKPIATPTEAESSPLPVGPVERAKRHALSIVQATNERHRKQEEAHQACQADDSFYMSPIGQLTYRLFAPCQLVNSSSCFSINPLNSSSPLSRRGSIDLNGPGSGATSPEPGSSHHQLSGQSADQQQVITSFGAFIPAISTCHLLGSSASGSNSHDLQHSPATTKAPTSNTKFTTNEFEAVEAIRRRMEVYVTTNSMKVVAGETLVLNLGDALSCLSTAIEQTLVERPIPPRRPSTWVSVYVLYAAVGEPLLPGQLLARQRGLDQINELDEGPPIDSRADKTAPVASDGQQEEHIFRDDFDLDPANKGGDHQTTAGQSQSQVGSSTSTSASTSTAAATNSGFEPPTNSAGEKSKVADSASSATSDSATATTTTSTTSTSTIFNSAYDRAVPLPTGPEQHFGSPAGCGGVELSGTLTLHSDALEALWVPNVETAADSQLLGRRRSSRDSDAESAERRRQRRRKPKRRSVDSQCSLI